MATLLDSDDITGELHPYIVRTGGTEDRWQYLTLFFISAALFAVLIYWDMTTHTVLFKWTLLCGGVALYSLYRLIMRRRTQWTIDTNGIVYVRTSLIGGEKRFLAAGDIERVAVEKSESHKIVTYTIIFIMNKGKPVRLEDKNSQAEVARILSEIGKRLPLLAVR